VQKLDVIEPSCVRRQDVTVTTHCGRTDRRPAGETQGLEVRMKRILVAATAGILAIMMIAGPVGARTFGAVYAHDQIYRVFGNAANVPDGTGTDPFAKFTNSTNADQLGVAEFAPGDPTGSHGGRWAVYTATWTTGDPSTLVTSWSQVESYASNGELSLVRNPAADFRCPVLGNPEPIG
jgi:hypothetical protein